MNSSKKRIIFACIIVVAGLLLTGCVERKLTIITRPEGALVMLNDEEIGESPVTVPFQWYGDYRIRIYKDGYQTLVTHKELKGPWYDKFPFDFFAQVVNPTRIADEYEWSFDLAPKKYPSRDDLIEQSQDLKKVLDQEPPQPPK